METDSGLKGLPNSFLTKYFSKFSIGKAAPDLPTKRSSAAFDRGGQTGPPRSNAFFFGAVDDTGAADDRPTTRSKVYLRRLQNAVI